MKPSLMIMAAWLLFGVSHFVLSHSALRQLIVARFGPRGFTIFYSMITILGMGMLIASVSFYGSEGRLGLGFGSHVAARWVLGVIGFLGAILTMAGLFNYPNSPMAVLAQRQRHQGKTAGNRLRPPTAIDRVTRHPFFVGLTILMTAHAFLASTLALATYFAGFAFVSSIGIYLQDRKLRQRWKEIYTDYESQTSTIPFANPQKPEEKVPEQMLRKWLISTLIAMVFLGLLHPFWRYANGALFAGFILAFGTIGVLVGLHRSGKDQQNL